MFDTEMDKNCFFSTVFENDLPFLNKGYAYVCDGKLRKKAVPKAAPGSLGAPTQGSSHERGAKTRS